MHAAPSDAPARARRLAASAAGALGRVVLLAAVILLAASYLPNLLGYHRYVLTGHSMEPSIHRGSLVFDEIVPVESLRKGDVVTYVPPGLSRPLSHRIVSVTSRDGRRIFRTKGDNNAIADPRPFTLDKRTQARVKFAIPYLGWAYIGLGDPHLRLWLLVLPAMALAAYAAIAVWREGGALIQERQEAPAR
jgi:signal peptidase